MRGFSIPSAGSFATSSVSEVYVSSFPATGQLRDRISQVLSLLQNLTFQEPTCQKGNLGGVREVHLFPFCAVFRDV
jgi:hypothetical protein